MFRPLGIKQIYNTKQTLPKQPVPKQTLQRNTNYNETNITTELTLQRNKHYNETNIAVMFVSPFQNKNDIQYETNITETNITTKQTLPYYLFRHLGIKQIYNTKQTLPKQTLP